MPILPGAMTPATGQEQSRRARAIPKDNDLGYKRSSIDQVDCKSASVHPYLNTPPSPDTNPLPDLNHCP